MSDTPLQTGNTAVSNVAPPGVGFSTTAPTPTTSQAGSATPITTPPVAPLNTQNGTQPTVLQPTQAFGNTPTGIATVSSPNPAPAILGGAQQTVDDYTKTLTPAPTALDSSQQALYDQIATLTGQDSGKDQAELDAENADGATQDQSDLNTLNGQLKNLVASYQANQVSLDTQAGVTRGVAAIQQGALDRTQAANVGLLTAQIQAKQGDLTLAQNTASRAVDAKYSTIEDNIKTAQAQLAALQPKMDAEQKTQSLAQSQFLQDQANKVAEDKATAKTNINTALSQGVTTPYANQNGQIFDAKNGEPFATPQDFFNAAGVSSFEEAYQKGLISDIKNTNLTFDNVTVNGQQQRIGYDAQGNIVSRTVIGSSKTGTGSGTTSKQDIQSMQSQLDTVKGGDGYISPEDYKQALSAWQQAGYSAASFKTNFQNYINPADTQDYK